MQCIVYVKQTVLESLLIDRMDNLPWPHSLIQHAIITHKCA